MRSQEPHDTDTRIRRIRDRAEDIRGSAAEARNLKIRASMLNIAKSYDKVADVLVRILPGNDRAGGKAAGSACYDPGRLVTAPASGERAEGDSSAQLAVAPPAIHPKTSEEHGVTSVNVMDTSYN